MKWQKMEFYSKTMILSMTQVSLLPYVKMTFFRTMCDTRLTNYTIALLINVEFCSIEKLNVLSYFFLQDFYPCLSTKFVMDGHTVVRKW